jgi:hypothetical protein
MIFSSETRQMHCSGKEKQQKAITILAYGLFWYFTYRFRQIDQVAVSITATADSSLNYQIPNSYTKGVKSQSVNALWSMV